MKSAYAYREPISSQSECAATISHPSKDLMNGLSLIHYEPKKVFPQSAKKILLVEDNHIIRIVHSQMLLDIECEIDVANDAEEALNFLGNQYDLILLDIGLPGMSGVELAKIIKSGATINKHTKIYALTAQTTDNLKEECFNSGIEMVLTKPVACDELQSLVREIYT